MQSCRLHQLDPGAVWLGAKLSNAALSIYPCIPGTAVPGICTFLVKSVCYVFV